MPTTPLSIHKMRQTAATIGHWTCSEGTGTTLADASGNGRTGTLSTAPATPTWVITGRHKQALSFDGVDDSVKILHHASLSPTAITIAAWVAIDRSGVDIIVGKQDTNAPRSGYDFNVAFQKVSFQVAITGGTINDATGPTAMSLTAWHWIVGTYDGTTIRIYLDGAAEATTAFAGTLAGNTLDLYLGRRPPGSVDSFFQGRLDNVQIRNVAMTADQIAAEFQLLTRVAIIS